MTDIKDMTDAELVEAVAREVLGYDVVSVRPNNANAIAVWVENAPLWIDLLHDMNDLQMVKDKFDRYRENMDRASGYYEVTLHNQYWQPVGYCIQNSNNNVRAWLEAALMAERGKE